MSEEEAKGYDALTVAAGELSEENMVLRVKVREQQATIEALQAENRLLKTVIHSARRNAAAVSDMLAQAEQSD